MELCSLPAIWKWSCSALFYSATPQTTRLPCQWDFSGNSTGVDCHFLLQGIIPAQGSNPGLPHCRQTLYSLSHQGSQYSHKGRLNLQDPETLRNRKCICHLSHWSFKKNFLHAFIAAYKHVIIYCLLLLLQSYFPEDRTMNICSPLNSQCLSYWHVVSTQNYVLNELKGEWVRWIYYRMAVSSWQGIQEFFVSQSLNGRLN